ncbi:hypothetical protein GCM10017673_23840 [Streptosporangium violaceochromogenes]|nr:hypothetical protein GCM10017673_23840 [Streptosporangium violaceochromogenes]
MPNLGVPELLIIGLVLVLLFGAKKLPDTARSLGRSLRIFKSETSKLREDDEPAPTATVVQPQPTAAPQPIAQAPADATVEEQARALEEQAARLRAQASTPKSQ